MSLAIRIGSKNEVVAEENGGEQPLLSGMFYINAVERYEKNYSNQITKHPLDSGASISDHVIMDNPVFTIQGVISGVDIDTNFGLRSGVVGGGEDSQTSESPINVRKSEISTTITKEDGGRFAKYIPDIVGQFLKNGGYTVTFNNTGGETPESLQEQVKTLIVDTMTRVTYNREKNRYFNNLYPVSLYEIDFNGVYKAPIENLSITSFVIKEDPDSGTALFFTMVLEQFRTVGLEFIDVPVEAAVSKSSKKTKDKGSVNPKTPTEEEAQAVNNSIDPARKARLDNRQ